MFSFTTSLNKRSLLSRLGGGCSLLLRLLDRLLIATLSTVLEQRDEPHILAAMAPGDAETPCLNLSTTLPAFSFCYFCTSRFSLRHQAFIQ